MRGPWVVLAGLLLGATPAFAAAPTAEQKTEFHRVCMGIADNETLCSCKAEAAMTLIDGDFMAMVIGAMKGAAVPKTTYVAYNTYVAKSNQICKPDY